MSRGNCARLHPGLLALGVPAVCLETCQVRAAMSAQRNKTDATDALGLAHLMRTGWFRQAHVKTEGAYRLKLLLNHRRNLKRKFLDLENAIRHSLKSFGVKLHNVSRGGFDEAVRDACAGHAITTEVKDCMLTARAVLWRQYLKLHNLVVRLVARDELCRRFMAIPGVGPVTALTFSTGIDDPSASGARATSPPISAWRQAMAVGHVDRRAGPHRQGQRSRGSPRALRGRQRMLTPYKGKTALKAAEDRQTLPQKASSRWPASCRMMHAMWRDGTSYTDRPHPDERRTALRRRRIASFWRPRMTLGEPFNCELAYRLSAQEIRPGG